MDSLYTIKDNWKPQNHQPKRRVTRRERDDSFEEPYVRPKRPSYRRYSRETRPIGTGITPQTSARSNMSLSGQAQRTQMTMSNNSGQGRTDTSNISTSEYLDAEAMPMALGSSKAEENAFDNLDDDMPVARSG